MFSTKKREKKITCLIDHAFNWFQDQLISVPYKQHSSQSKSQHQKGNTTNIQQRLHLALPFDIYIDFADVAGGPLLSITFWRLHPKKVEKGLGLGYYKHVYGK